MFYVLADVVDINSVYSVYATPKNNLDKIKECKN